MVMETKKNANDVYNARYTLVEDIMARLTSRFKNIPWDETEVEEWCGECVVDRMSMAPEWLTYLDIKIKVEDYKAKVPCNVYRLLKVKDDNGYRAEYSDYDGTYIRFDTDSTQRSYIYIDYYGLPVNIDGALLIPKTHILACFYYCLHVYYEPIFLSGDMDIARYQHIVDSLEDNIGQASTSFKELSQDDIEDMIRTQHNMVRNVVSVPEKLR